MSPDPLHRLRRRRGSGRSGDTGHRVDAGPQDGFILLESLLSITLLAIIMAALTTFSVTVTNSTTYQRQRQAAVQLANSTLEQVRGLTASDLYLGRSAASTAAQFSGASGVVAPWLASMTKTADSTSSTAILPVTTQATLNGTQLTSTSYLGWCSVSSDASTGADCTPAAAASAGFLRAVVAVTWAGSRCPAGVCTYLTSTLVSTAADPVFTLNQAAPPAPIVQDPGTLASVVGDTSTPAVTPLPLQMTLADGTGVAPVTWVVTGLPPGLSADSAGLVTGSPTRPGTYPVTATATDAFVRTSDPVTFTWNVYPPVTAADPGAQSSVRGRAITALTLAAAGGSGGPYTWTDGGSLPAGLALSSAGVVTGTPSAVGTSTVTVTATDGGGRKGRATFGWTVVYPPLTATAPNRTWTVGTSVGSVQFTASGGSGSGYTWADPSTTLPAGLTISSGGVVTGTPTATGVRAVKLRVTDATAGSGTDVPFTWTILARPGVDGLTDPFSTTRGATVATQSLTYSCPSLSCSLTLTGAPAGVGIATDTTGGVGTVVTVTAASGTVYLRGQVAGSATAGPYPVRVTPLDTVSSTVGTAASATWTVLAPPTASGLVTPVRTTAGATVATQSLSYTCPSGSCTLVLGGAPAGIGLSATPTSAVGPSLSVTGTSGTVYLRGTVAASTPAGSSTVTLTPTDSTTSVAGPPSTAAWTVNAPPTVTGLPPTYSAAQGTAIPTTGLPYTCPSGSCTIALTGAPVGLGIAPDTTSPVVASVNVTATSGTVYLRGTISATATIRTYQVVVTPTDTTTTVVGSATTTALTVTARCTAAQQTAYATAVTADAPSTWFRLGETSGTVATDAGSARRNGIYVGGPTLGVPGALTCDPSTAIGLNGTSGQIISTAPQAAAPATFTVEAWFSTTVGGGKIIGYGNSQAGTSSGYDRHVYLTDSGQIVFGVYNNGFHTIVSPGTYLDGKYHQVAASLSPTAGMVLYVDGAQVATDAATRAGENSTGWWRIGYDNLNGWPGQPTRFFFTGSLDEVAVYPTALTAARLAAHYAADR